MLTTTVKKWGNSKAVRLPSSTLESLSINEDDELMITIRENEIVLSPRKQANSIEELFKDYTSDYDGNPEIDWGEPVGREVW